MADIDDILTPLKARLLALRAGAVAPKAAYIHNTERSNTVKEHCWYVTVGDREIERHIGRYKERTTLVCTYAVGDMTKNAVGKRQEAAEMMQSAIVDFNTKLVLADGILVSEIDPVTTAGVLDLEDASWAASQLNLTATRWVEYGA